MVPYVVIAYGFLFFFCFLFVVCPGPALCLRVINLPLPCAGRFVVGFPLSRFGEGGKVCAFHCGAPLVAVNCYKSLRNARDGGGSRPPFGRFGLVWGAPLSTKPCECEIKSRITFPSRKSAISYHRGRSERASSMMFYFCFTNALLSAGRPGQGGRRMLCFG